jgi:hypothetical protein
MGACVLGALVLSCTGVASAADDDAALKAAHEELAPKSKTDEMGVFGPVPVSHPGRRYPASFEFPTGPEVGERLPEFVLPDQNGEPVDFHNDRGTDKSIVVFFRSAVW